jgi:hypothetical protein
MIVHPAMMPVTAQLLTQRLEGASMTGWCTMPAERNSSTSSKSIMPLR